MRSRTTLGSPVRGLRILVLLGLAWLASGCATIHSVNRLSKTELHGSRRLEAIKPCGVRPSAGGAAGEVSLEFSDGGRRQVRIDRPAGSAGGGVLLLLEGEFRPEVAIQAPAQVGHGGRARRLPIARALASTPTREVLFKGHSEPDPWSDEHELQVMTLARIVAADDAVIHLERVRTVSLRYGTKGRLQLGELAWRAGVVLPALVFDVLTLPIQGGLFAILAWSGH